MCVTFFPAEAGVPQYPVFVVIKVDFSVGWEEGMGKLPCCSIKAMVNERLQTVCVVDRVETYFQVTFHVAWHFSEAEG